MAWKGLGNGEDPKRSPESAPSYEITRKERTGSFGIYGAATGGEHLWAAFVVALFSRTVPRRQEP